MLELWLNPFSYWAGRAQKCYDTGPGTDILGFCFFFFFRNSVAPSPPITHTDTQSLQRESDRTATLRIRVRSVEHVVCHINSGCWGKFGELPPPPSLPITGMVRRLIGQIRRW